MTGRRVTIHVDGREVPASEGESVAIALLAAGIDRTRTSVSGEPRGPLCAMGICFECRVTRDGQPHVRSCLEPCHEGLRVETGLVALEIQPSVVAVVPERVEADVVVVGAGPAGLAAASEASAAGLSVILLDEGPAVGGQIWRGALERHSGPAAPGWAPPAPRRGQRLLRGLEERGARFVWRCTVVDASPERLLASGPLGALQVRYGSLVLATGARERFLPFPGWTLPNVMGAGAAQALLKGGASFAGKRVGVAGSGPLLLAVASLLRRHGASVPFVLEQAPARAVRRLALRLVARPARLFQAAALRASLLGVPYRTGWWVSRADGEGRLERVTLTDGTRIESQPLDVLACGFGLVPNLELARLLGCELEGGAVRVDERQRTSVDSVYAAGETTGVGGLPKALLEGAIAGRAVAGRDVRSLARRREVARRFARELERTFALREELRHLAGPDTVVCRCEDVRLAELDPAWSRRQAKLATRLGMGACQGRVCGTATEALFGWRDDVCRPPLSPVPLGVLASGTPDGDEKG